MSLRVLLRSLRFAIVFTCYFATIHCSNLRWPTILNGNDHNAVSNASFLRSFSDLRMTVYYIEPFTPDVEGGFPVLNLRLDSLRTRSGIVASAHYMYVVSGKGAGNCLFAWPIKSVDFAAVIPVACEVYESSFDSNDGDTPLDPYLVENESGQTIVCVTFAGRLNVRRRCFEEVIVGSDVDFVSVEFLYALPAANCTRAAAPDALGAGVYGHVASASPAFEIRVWDAAGICAWSAIERQTENNHVSWQRALRGVSYGQPRAIASLTDDVLVVLTSFDASDDQNASPHLVLVSASTSRIISATKISFNQTLYPTEIANTVFCAHESGIVVGKHGFQGARYATVALFCSEFVGDAVFPYFAQFVIDEGEPRFDGHVVLPSLSNQFAYDQSAGLGIACIGDNAVIVQREQISVVDMVFGNIVSRFMASELRVQVSNANVALDAFLSSPVVDEESRTIFVTGGIQWKTNRIFNPFILSLSFDDLFKRAPAFDLNSLLLQPFHFTTTGSLNAINFAIAVNKNVRVNMAIVDDSLYVATEYFARSALDRFNNDQIEGEGYIVLARLTPSLLIAADGPAGNDGVVSSTGAALDADEDATAGGENTTIWVIIGVGIALCVLGVCFTVVICLLTRRKRRRASSATVAVGGGGGSGAVAANASDLGLNERQARSRSASGSSHTLRHNHDSTSARFVGRSLSRTTSRAHVSGGGNGGGGGGGGRSRASSTAMGGRSRGNSRAANGMYGLSPSPVSSSTTYMRGAALLSARRPSQRSTASARGGAHDDSLGGPNGGQGNTYGIIYRELKTAATSSTQSLSPRGTTTAGAAAANSTGASGGGAEGASTAYSKMYNVVPPVHSERMYNYAPI